MPVQKSSAYYRNGFSPLRGTWLVLRRLGRACLWHDPAFYRWVGRLRGHGDCLRLDFDLWVDGFPGSASGLAASAFQKANPDARVVSRNHLPPFILHAIYNFKPGVFLLGKPEDVVVSWTIVSKTSLRECLDYYVDFHRMLVPNAPWLFVVTIEELISQPGTVMDAFNLHYRTNFRAPGLRSVADSARSKKSDANELKIVRPAPSGSSLRMELRQQLRETPSLKRKLDYARRLHGQFIPGARCAPAAPLDVTTRRLPALA